MTASSRSHVRFRRLAIPLRLLVVLTSLPTLILGLSGCTASRYKLASKKTSPPVPINLPSTEPPIEALVHTVIIYRGPGSWKRNAYWDEYVVTVANRGNASLAVQSASLTDINGQDSLAGTDPWELETTSRT